MQLVLEVLEGEGPEFPGREVDVGGVASLFLSYDQVMVVGLFFALFAAYDAYNLSRGEE